MVAIAIYSCGGGAAGAAVVVTQRTSPSEDFSIKGWGAVPLDSAIIAWDLVVVDEAHKLRNAYRPSNKVGQRIRWATEGCLSALQRFVGRLTKRFFCRSVERRWK
jgi:hypothetical protein